MLKHALKYISGELIGKALPFLTLPIFTRWLSVEEFGIVAIYLVIVQLASEIFGIGLKGSYVRYIYDKKTDRNPDFFSSIVTLLILYSASVFLIVYLFQDSIQKILDVSYFVLWMGILSGFLDSFFRLFLAKFEAEKNSRIHVVYNVSRTIALFSLSLLLVYSYTTEKYVGRIEGQVWAFGLLLLVVFITNWDSFRIYLKKRHVQYAIVFGLPILMHQISGFILNVFDQAMISSILGKRELGIYSFAYRIAVIIQILIMAVQKAWIPEFYADMNRSSFKSIQQKFQLYSKGTLLTAIILILFSNELYYFFAPSEYHAGSNLIPILVTSYVFYFLYAIYGQVMIYRNKNAIFSLITVISGLINIGANYILLPKFGNLGAAFSTMISFFILFLLNWIFCFVFFEKNSLIKLKLFVVDFSVLAGATFTALLFLDFELSMSSLVVRLALLLLIFIFLVRSYSREILALIRK